VTKQVFRVNLAQIRSAVPEILDSQNKQTNKQKFTDSAKNRILRSSLRAVKTYITPNSVSGSGLAAESGLLKTSLRH